MSDFTGQPQPAEQPVEPVTSGEPAGQQPASPQPAPPRYGAYAPDGQMPSAPPVGMPVAPPLHTPQAGGSPYGSPMPAGPLLRVGDALRFGWHHFKANWGAWVVFTLLVAVVQALFVAPYLREVWAAMVQAIDAARAGNATPDAALNFGFSPAMMLALTGGVVQTVLLGFGLVAALRTASGDRPSIVDFFRSQRLGQVALTALVLGVAAQMFGMGGVLGIAWQILTVFAVAFVYDRSQRVFQSISASFTLVGKNFGAVFLLLLAIVGINALGALALGLGLLVTAPISLLAVAFAFRRLAGGAIV